MTEKDFSENLIHRDLSWLAFNERVLNEAKEESNPLLEQIKFLAIFVNNLDEFLMVRVAGLKRLLDTQYNRKDAFGWYAPDLYVEIKARTAILMNRLYEIYQTNALPKLAEQNVSIKAFDQLTDDEKQYAKRYFETTLFPIITPMAVDQGHPFPILPSKTLAFAIHLDRQGETHLGILPVPRSVARLLSLPSSKNEVNYILIDDLIREYMDMFFKGFALKHCARFRVIRDSEMSGSEEYGPDLLKAIESEIKKRPKAKVVYMEVEKGCSPALLEDLIEANGLPEEEIAFIDGHFDLSFLFQLSGEVNKVELCYPSFTSAKIEYDNIFDRIKEDDFMMHLPYQSFFPTVDFIAQAADDPDVLAIKMTLYRTNQDSAIIEALKKAAQNKKQVSVLVEIKARFDEEQNINWARELEQAGCHVMYGILGMKIHSKIAMVVRQEEDRIRRYVHLSTGNYNEKTAKIYTDLGFFTADYKFTRDVSEVFNVITGYSLPSRWSRLISAPHDMRPFFLEMIDKEIEYQNKFGNGFIWAKMNSLEDPEVIHKLYEASQAGVKIQLIVRGICSLIPGVKGFSETIEVRSIVGRFLEHTRIYMFGNNGDERYFLSSADFMRRNFDRRIELLFEIDLEKIKSELHKLLELHWKDNTKSWFLQDNGTYRKYTSRNKAFNVQEYLIGYYSK